MTSSPDARDEMPPALASMWRLCKLGLRHEPWLASAALFLALLTAVPDSLLALWLKLLGDGVLDGDRTKVLIAALGLAVSTTSTWVLRTVTTRIERRFRDKVTIALESHAARLLASISTIAHQERPEYLDRLSVLRNQVFVLDHMYISLFATSAWVLRLAITASLLVSVHPALALLALFALPTVLTSSWRPAVERTAEERAAEHERLARHFFQTATLAAPGKEVRVTGIGQRLMEGRREAWERWYAPVAAARWSSAAWYTLAWAVFGSGYVGAVVFVASVIEAGPGAVLLVLAAGARLTAYINGAVAEIGFLRGIWLDGSRRLAWLEDYAAASTADEDAPVPGRLVDGIRLEGVSFRYPGTDRLVLRDIDLHLPAGSVVAIVGENGAGKTTLVKLLCKLYEPTAGRILVDGTPLSRLPAAEWRARLAGAFQDFFRFEFLAGQSVGVGDLPRLEEEPAVVAAVGRAGAEDVVERLPLGLRTQLGRTWSDGVEVSFGQWQKLALARGFMRAEPLLLIMDEPTAALDAETEHALFERYSRAARGARNGEGVTVTSGRITILVSHRFSTVRMADLIVVMDGARVVEVGTHEQLMAKRGQYAELYTIQASAYSTS